MRTACTGCGERGEPFMLHDTLYRSIGGHVCFPDCFAEGVEWDHPAYLCLNCVEERLGRPIRREDLTDAPINASFVDRHNL